MHLSDLTFLHMTFISSSLLGASSHEMMFEPFVPLSSFCMRLCIPLIAIASCSVFSVRVCCSLGLALKVRDRRWHCFECCLLSPQCPRLNHFVPDCPRFFLLTCPAVLVHMTWLSLFLLDHGCHAELCEIFTTSSVASCCIHLCTAYSPNPTSLWRLWTALWHG